MGLNTTVVVCNDSLYDIENDSEFGKNLATAIQSLSGSSGPIKVSSQGSSAAATVVETHHADNTILTATRGNTGKSLGLIFPHGKTEDTEEVKILRGLADQLGYRIVKKTK